MARILNSVTGHQNTIGKLLSAWESGRLPSTFLFAGPSGIGKKRVALGLAQALVCERSAQACGQCPPCLRLEQGQSESLLQIAPEKSQIKIEQSRSILDFLSLQAVGKSRVIIIEEAQSLNPQAANSLLKILEEPPKATYFFLLAPSARSVLATIRSRSQVVRFQPLTVTEMKRVSQAPDWALSASGGSFEWLNQLTDQDELELRNRASRFLSQVGDVPRFYLDADFRETLKVRVQAQSVARHFVSFLRDCMILQSGGDQLRNPDQSALLNKLIQFPKPAVQKIAQKALQLEPAILANRDSLLLYEEFWLHSNEVLGVK